MNKNRLIEQGVLRHETNGFNKLKMNSLGGCSITASRIGGGWVSAFFVMLRDGKQGVVRGTS